MDDEVACVEDAPEVARQDVPMTCGVAEFARIIGVNLEKAREIVASVNRPPGFYIGRKYRVLRSEIEGWLAELSSTGKPVVRL